MDNDYFYDYVMECIDLQGNNEELFSVENLCDTCSNNLHSEYGDDCYFLRDINTVAHDDKGNGIICSCDSYNKC